MSQRGNNNSHNQWLLYVSKLKRCKKRRKEYCPICQKKILILHYNKHVEQCSKISELRAKMYNEDVVNMNRNDECAICLDSMECGQRIARLKCLCVYHKTCIDLWLNKNIWCPNHPPP